MLALVETGVAEKTAVYVVFTVGMTACEIEPPLLQLFQSYLNPFPNCGVVVSIE